LYLLHLSNQEINLLYKRNSKSRSIPEATQSNSASLEDKMANESIIRIPPYYYIHVLDQNSNVTRVEIGPKTYIRQDNERIILAPKKMVMIPPRHYCIILNPVVRGVNGAVHLDALGQVRLAHADLEIRMAQDPFPLYPGEELKKDITPLQIVMANTALHLKALLDFEDDQAGKYVAGDEWLFEGPGTYIPRKEVEIVETIVAAIIRPNQAIKLQARKECEDRDGNKRVTGEEWMVKKVGAYLPGVFEEVVNIVDAVILTEKKALHLRATKTFRDSQGIVRKTGEEWLVTMVDTEAHIPDVYEEVLGITDIITLNSCQYCVVCDPLGGEKSFFLRPGEWLKDGIQDIYILSEEDGLLLRAVRPIEDKNEVGGPESLLARDDEDILRKPGDRWLIRGPLEYIPPAEVEVMEQRHAIPLAENEGIYVRDIKTGKIRAVIGHSYMLSQDEELWEKHLPGHVEDLLSTSRDPLLDRSKDSSEKGVVLPRDKTRAVVVFGPELVLLGPDEQFTVLSLSGGRPKRPHTRRSLCLLLGPDFCTDIITIETADHARLQLQLAYNWHFEIPSAAEATRLFSVPDFIGDACKTLASRIRGAVAAVTFDDFHKNSNRLICAAVFGFDGEGNLRHFLRFAPNGLVISSVDIQSVEPVDQRTRDALQRSVQLAIEITTNSQEAAARHEAERLEQEAQGRLERQKILDLAESERARKELLELEALSTAVERTGVAKAEAQSRAEAARIEGEGAVLQAKLNAQATAIETESELLRLSQAREHELRFSKEQVNLDVARAEALAAVEIQKFEAVIKALGASTVRDIAVAGPEMQVKLLQGLGIQSTLITDGSSPINLFTTAGGLLGILPKPSET
ncbi:Major vault protein alpha, partial [Ophiophagus hannah]